jgi:dTDP-glucose 4,6-dehydratase
VRVLVTGGAGFIGSNLVRHLLRTRDDLQVTNLDALTYAGTRTSLADVEDDPRYRFVHGDIADEGLLAEVVPGHDVIVNVAAESHNSLAVVDPLLFFRTNVLGTVALLDAARRAEVDRFHHVSTCEVYGDLALDAEEAFHEDSPYRPRTPYNASKAGADHAVRAFHETFTLPITITNCANNYGPYQFPEKVIPLFTTNALDGRPLPVYASSDNRREWIHVEDHVRAIALVLERGQVGATYHVGTGEERSVADLADAILAHTGADRSLLHTVPDRPGHDRRYLLDSTRIRDELGWTPRQTFDEGLAETVAWYRDRRDWWEPLRDRAPVDEGAAWTSGAAGTGTSDGGRP